MQREGESWVVEGDLLAARLGGGSEPCLISTGQATSHTSPHFLWISRTLDFPRVYLKGPSCQIRSVREWYHWIRLSLGIYRFKFFILFSPWVFKKESKVLRCLLLKSILFTNGFGGRQVGNPFFSSYWLAKINVMKKIRQNAALQALSIFERAVQRSKQNQCIVPVFVTIRGGLKAGRILKQTLFTIFTESRHSIYLFFTRV